MVRQLSWSPDPGVEGRQESQAGVARAHTARPSAKVDACAAPSPPAACWLMIGRRKTIGFWRRFTKIGSADRRRM